MKQIFKTMRSYGTFWLAKQSLNHLKNIRNHELEVILELLPPEGRVLEIGAGTGWQAQALAEKGYRVSAIDLPSSKYRKNLVWAVDVYDGKKIPFEENTFDIVFSSNVLEHVPHVYEFQQEIQRVLKPEGCALHILPSSSWRFWTNLTVLVRNWRIPKVHGEQAGNSLMEMYYFSRRWWVGLFRDTGWTVVGLDTTRLFYTGRSIMDSRLGISTRVKLGRVLGNSCNVFVLRKVN